VVLRAHVDNDALAVAITKIGRNPLGVKLTCIEYNGSSKDRLNIKNRWP